MTILCDKSIAELANNHKMIEPFISKQVRADDKGEKIFNKRMEEYREQTLPMIESMRNGSSFLEISTTKSLGDVSDEIFKRLNEI